MPVEYDEKGTYIFSSKDLCLLKEIPDIISMGVDSVKIEGRLKTEYYLASVILFSFEFLKIFIISIIKIKCCQTSSFNFIDFF